jgi:anti-anti-sigma factor
MAPMEPEEFEFTVHVAEDSDRVVVTPRGELDMDTQPQLREVLEAHIARSVTLDLSGLRFVDTSGLRLILETAEGARRDGVAFRVLPGGPAVQRLFEVAGVVDLIPFHESTEGGPS